MEFGGEAVLGAGVVGFAITGNSESDNLRFGVDACAVGLGCGVDRVDAEFVFPVFVS
jgi:hypothetical protein